MSQRVQYIYNEVVRLYENFYLKVFHYRDFVFIPIPKQDKMIYNFIFVLEKKYDNLYSVGDKFLFSYFGFQFQYWESIHSIRGRKGIPLEWVIGKKAFERWINRNKEETDFFVKDFLFRYKIVNVILEEKDVSNVYLNFNEEIYKNRKFNTIDGFIVCLSFTNLYSSKSMLCLRCKFRKDCKKLKDEKYSTEVNIQKE